MKKIITILTVIAMFGFQACEGPEGPPGQDGQDGDNLISEVFEVAPINFTQGNSYSSTFPLDPKIYSGDNLLIYELVSSNNGIDVWALLPQVYYFDTGTAQYNYTFSLNQFTIFIDGSFPLAQLPASFLNNKIFRIVIVPGDDGVNAGGPNSKMSGSKPDYSDYNAVIKKYNIDDSNVKRLN